MRPIEVGRVDEEGRVEIPLDFREGLQVGPGDEVAIELVNGRIEVRPRASREEFAEKLRGCIDAETRARDTEPIDPRGLEAMWTDDLPE